MYSRKLAQSLAKQYRTCPPRKVRADAHHKESLKQHLTICPYCSTQQIEGPDPWEELASKLQEIHSLTRSPPIDKHIIEGQLRPVMSGLGRWREGYFYNPPLVLVLEIRKTISDDILVAQTYHDIYLAGPGDLIIPDEKFPAGPFFVEPWNTYALKAGNLDPALEQFPDEIVKAVRALEKDPEAYPVWAMQPRPFTQNDSRIYFRQLEVEVGYTFSVQAVEELMDELEFPSLRLVYASPSETQQSIREKVPGISWSGEQKSFEEVFALGRFPAERLPLAAAGEGRKRFPANLVLIRDGAVQAFEPVILEVFLEQSFPESREMSGRISGIPEGLKGSFLICFLEIRGQKPLSPERSHWEEGTGSFFAKFRVKGDAEGKISVAVVFDLTGSPHG